jgi:hypothetical protein
MTVQNSGYRTMYLQRLLYRGSAVLSVSDN